MKVLLDHGANVNGDGVRDRPLLAAIENANIEAVRTLLQAGAKLDGVVWDEYDKAEQVKEQQDERGCRALTLVIDSASWGRDQELWQPIDGDEDRDCAVRVELLQLLIDHGARIGMPDDRMSARGKWAGIKRYQALSRVLAAAQQERAQKEVSQDNGGATQ